jgi:DNA-binding beta-propeller fold protein YncE
MSPQRPDGRRLTRRSFLRWGGVTAAGIAIGGGLTLAESRGWLAHRRPHAPVPSPQGTPAAGTTTAASTRPVALIANSLSDTLTLADARTLEPFDTLDVGREPHKFRQSLDGRSVYSCNTSSNELIEIDLETLRPVRHIPILDPYNVIFTKDGRSLYKVAYRYTFVEIHDGATFQRIKRLHTGRSPSHMWFSPDGRWFVNTNQHSHTVTVIDTEKMAVTHTLAVDPVPAGIEISRDGAYMFVASGGAGTISVFATQDWRLVKKVHSGKDAHEMVATRDGRTIFVTNRREDTVSAFDVAHQQVVDKFSAPGGPDMPMLSGDGAHLWISGRFGDVASVIDTRTLKILNTFPTGHSPHGVFLGTTRA